MGVCSANGLPHNAAAAGRRTNHTWSSRALMTASQPWPRLESPEGIKNKILCLPCSPSSKSVGLGRGPASAGFENLPGDSKVQTTLSTEVPAPGWMPCKHCVHRCRVGGDYERISDISEVARDPWNSALWHLFSAVSREQSQLAKSMKGRWPTAQAEPTLPWARCSTGRGGKAGSTEEAATSCLCNRGLVLTQENPTRQGRAGLAA